jgi:hypothetical protein
MPAAAGIKPGIKHHVGAAGLVDTRIKEILYIRQISHYFAHINCQLGAV